MTSACQTTTCLQTQLSVNDGTKNYLPFLSNTLLLHDFDGDQTRELQHDTGGAAVFLNSSRGLNNSVYIKYLSLLTRCRINCLLMESGPSDRLESAQELTFHIGKASSYSQQA